MNSPILIGLATGTVAAILFASITAQTTLAFILFYLTPLPLFLAGLGWGVTAALIAALIGGGLVGAVLGNTPALVFTLFVGLPPIVLCRLAMQSRLAPMQPAGEGAAQPSIEWYPPGRLIGWAALLGGAMTAVAILALGPGEDAYKATIRGFFEQQQFRDLIARQTQLSPEQLDRLIDLFASFLLPAFAAILWLAITLFNIWAAGKIVLFSGRLQRPWPTFSDMTYPNFVIFGMPAAIALSFAPGMAGILATCFVGAFSVAYLLLGLIVIRVLTNGLSAQPLLMAAVYIAILLLGWAALIVIAIGIAEPLFNLRRNWGTPPAASGPSPNE